MEKLNEILKKLRKERKIGKQELARMLKITQVQIELLENGEFHKIPLANLKKILEKYENFFNLEEGELLYLIEERKPKDILIKEYKKNKNIYLLTFIILIIFFIIYQVVGLILPPEIKIYSPKNNSFVFQKEIIIEGFVDPRASFFINKEETVPEKNGYFKKMIILKPGLNEFTLEAKNYLGIWNKKELKLYYKGL